MPDLIRPTQTSFVSGRHIFVLCIERLSHGISDVVKRGHWKPIRLALGGTPSTHLFFADDFILLAEASYKQAMVINGILNVFCMSSGKRVSKTKTQVFFSQTYSQLRLRKLVLP